MGESRYTTLMKKHPQRAQELFVAAAQEAHERRETLKRIVNEQTKN
jgi:hypothetical protein